MTLKMYFRDIVFHGNSGILHSKIKIDYNNYNEYFKLSEKSMELYNFE